MPDEQTPDSRELGLNLTLAQVGFEIVSPLIAGLLIDYFVGTMPWCTLGGIVVGFVGGVTHIVLLSNKQEAARREKQRKLGSGSP